jgi:capsular polysaccharide biosynthesis protein
MELRQYIQIVWDRRLIVLATTLVAFVAAAASVLLLPQAATSYQASIQIGVRPRNFPEESYRRFYEYYGFLSSEYLNDDIINIVEGGGFLDAIRARLAPTRPGAPPNGSIKGKKAHRVIAFTVSSDRSEDAMDIAKTIADLLNNPGPTDPRYLEFLSEQRPIMTVIDAPRLTTQSAVRRGAFDIAVRTALGLIVGLGLAFLFHYLDDTIRDRSEVESLTDLPILAEIPRAGQRPT